jgi:hypothetical protein
MESRSVTGLSKAAANRRRAHQIPPRKRPTQLSLPMLTSRIISRPAASTRPRKESAKAKIQKLDHQSSQQRGETRDTFARCNSNLVARRILASRHKPTDPSIVEYKIHWETSWEVASTIQGPVLKKWQEALDDKETFTYKSQEGGKWTVLKDSHEMENDSEDMQWEMWLAIRRNVIEEAKKNWFAEMPELDLVFANNEEETRAFYQAQENDLMEPTSALAMFQSAWQALSQNPLLPETGISYGDIRVLFIAQLDPAYNDESNTSGVMQRPILTVAETIRYIHSVPFDNLDEQAFNRSRGTYNNYTHWRTIVRQFIRVAPFMFKTGTWMQLFASLLLGGSILQAELAAVGIEVQDDWCARAREYGMHMYYDRVVDQRPTHDIQETFLNLRDFFRELAPEDDTM